MLVKSKINKKETEYQKIKGFVSLIRGINVGGNNKINMDDLVKEYEEIIIGTSSATILDWKKIYLFGWIIQTCHSLNLTQVLAIYFYELHDVLYSTFYLELLKAQNGKQ